MSTVVRRTAARWRAAAALVATALLAACGDDQAADPLAPESAPQLVIRDAARGGEANGFYFLTPIAPTLSTYPGTFDGGRFPAVDV
jgi:hypothetical protein